MPSKQAVIVKGQRNGINIMLDETAEFEKIQETLREKVTSAKRFFEGANTNISFKGRSLTETEEQHLLDIILAETTLDVDFVESEGFVPPSPSKPALRIFDKSAKPEKPERAADKPEKEPPSEPMNFVLPSVKIDHPDASAPLNLSHTESDTAYYRGGLRSGQSIKYPGSVVVMGDVNPGSEIVAGGNVIVLGSLKGMAHAGSKGDANCFVSALVLQPTQLRIGKYITNIAAPKKGAKKEASYAYVKDEQVFVAAL